MSKSIKNHLLIASTFTLAVATPLLTADADPLPGQQLKFQQLPLSGTLVTNTTGTTTAYNGHSEFSTAYVNAATQTYTGGYFADDFADKVSTPVVHVKWWGSYLGTVGQPANTAQKFLIAFESDIPAGTGGISYSRPGNLLQYEIVTLGALSPNSGTFTETLQQAVPGGENLYRYNAELKTPFPEQADTVYWIKIVALDDSGQVPGLFQWGWHNRDYTQQDTLASNVPSPGEFNESSGTPVATIWHFQDDAVRGNITVAPTGLPGQFSITQGPATPSSYQDLIDGPMGIGGGTGLVPYSQDLAFELYTIPIPEPASFGLLAAAGVGLLGLRTRRA